MNKIDYIRLAMDASNGAFAWYYFGVTKAQCANPSEIDAHRVSPDRCANQFLKENYPTIWVEAQEDLSKLQGSLQGWY
tara:strand:+ start:920 stop:1153 length:234 start_codon:yes stop_codon:yes gene_type:complete